MLTTTSPAFSIVLPAADKGVKRCDSGTIGTTIPEAALPMPLITLPSLKQCRICLHVAEVADVEVVGSLAPGAFDLESAKFIGLFLQEGFQQMIEKGVMLLL